MPILRCQTRTQFQLKTHSKHRTDNVLSFWEEKRKRQTWINKPDLKCSILLCSCTNSHSTDSYPRIKIKIFYWQVLIVLCKREKSLIDYNIPLNINYSEHYYFNLHKYYTGNALEKHFIFFFTSNTTIVFLIASRNSPTAATFFHQVVQKTGKPLNGQE